MCHPLNLPTFLRMKNVERFQQLTKKLSLWDKIQFHFYTLTSIVHILCKFIPFLYTIYVKTQHRLLFSVKPFLSNHFSIPFITNWQPNASCIFNITDDRNEMQSKVHVRYIDRTFKLYDLFVYTVPCGFIWDFSLFSNLNG